MKKAIMIILSFLNCAIITGQPEIIYDPYYKFEIYSTKQGLTNNRINDIYQDSNGILWVATERGLNKFDGYNFNFFLNSSDDSLSISGDIITAVVEDQKGHLWIATNNGLDVLNSENYTFIHVFPFEKIKPSDAAKFVRAILIENDSIVWFDTSDGVLYRYDNKNGTYKTFKHEKPGQIFTYYYHDLFDDGKGNVWIGGRGMNPCKFNKTTENFTYYESNPNDNKSKRDKDVTRYYIDINGDFWIGGVDGLYQFKNEKFYKFIGGTTYDIIDLNQDELWLSNGLGLKIYNRKENKIYSLNHSDENKFSIPSNYVFKLYVDNSGVMWIGTMNGLCKYSPYKNKFKRIFHIYGDNKTISSNHINALIQDTSGNIWVGTRNNGIDIINSDFIKFEHFDTSDKSKYKLSSNRISSICRDSKNNIFIGLWAGIGFNLIEAKTNQIKLITLDKSTRKLDWYNDFFEDSNGILWIGTWGSCSLVPFDPDKNDFIGKPSKSGPVFKKLGTHFISCIDELDNDRLMIGTTNRGITIFNKNTKDVRFFDSKTKDSISLWGQNVSCIFNDGEIWVGAEGLNKFDPQTNAFKHFTTENGLCDDKVKAILKDDFGKLWISTSNGISRFDIENNTFTNFYQKDGAAMDEYTKAALKLKDGRLLFGNNDGLTIIDPEKIIFNTHKPKAFLRRIKIFEKSPLLNEYEDGKIELKHNRNYITFDFGSDDLSDVDNNIFAYKLDGFEQDWHYTKIGQHIATYTYVNAGEYNFMLKTANADRIWSDILTVPVKVKLPFWKTWWFIVFEIFIVGMLFYWYIKQREAKLKEEHFMQTLEQRLLRSQMNPHFIFNALGAIQSYIFSHNPFEAATYLSKFADLMRSILYASREEYISLEKELKVLENYLEIQQLRFENKFEFNIEIDEKLNTEFTSVPPLLIQPLLENSIEHGFKELTEKGILKIKISKNGKKLKIEVEDNGKGIENKNEINNKINEIQNDNKHKSMALQIIKRRLYILNKEKNGKFDLKIENILDRQGNKHGLKISFFIPLIYL